MAKHVTLVSLSKTVAVASTAEAIAPDNTWVRSAVIQAKKVAANNAGNIHIGLSALDQGVAELIELAPGDDLPLNPNADVVFDLGTIYVDADIAGDGITCLYVPE